MKIKLFFTFSLFIFIIIFSFSVYIILLHDVSCIIINTKERVGDLEEECLLPAHYLQCDLPINISLDLCSLKRKLDLTGKTGTGITTAPHKMKVNAPPLLALRFVEHNKIPSKTFYNKVIYFIISFFVTSVMGKREMRMSLGMC